MVASSALELAKFELFYDGFAWLITPELKRLRRWRSSLYESQPRCFIGLSVLTNALRLFSTHSSRVGQFTALWHWYQISRNSLQPFDTLIDKLIFFDSLFPTVLSCCGRVFKIDFVKLYCLRFESYLEIFLDVHDTACCLSRLDIIWLCGPFYNVIHYKIDINQQREFIFDSIVVVESK